MNEVTNKELLIRLMDKAETIENAVTIHAEHARNVDNHLASLNSKVAKHEQRLGGLRDFKTKMVTYGTVALLVVPYFINKMLN